jgi:alpha/beta superfamily hydrolase
VDKPQAVPARQASDRQNGHTFFSGITLTGLLTLPPASGPHPAIVVVHGSERGERNDFLRQQLSGFMASHGIAVLTYDKRGVGDSGGVYQEVASEANVSLLAQDALAGVSYLKGRSDIAIPHIGLIGSSQAGWIIPRAAQSGDVAFFVILSGAVVSVGIENAYSSYTNDGAARPQYSPAEISEKLALAQSSGFDPVPVMMKLTQPGLWLWGDQDKSMPVPESPKNLIASLRKASLAWPITSFQTPTIISNNRIKACLMNFPIHRDILMISS